MSKTPFSKKCEIIGELWSNYREQAASDPVWEEFFYYNDISLPLAYMVSNNIAMINIAEDGEELIEETWQMFCEFIKIDHEEYYESIGEAFDASPNPPLEVPDE